jgi:hypothetical protein
MLQLLTKLRCYSFRPDPAEHAVFTLHTHEDYLAQSHLSCHVAHRLIIRNKAIPDQNSCPDKKASEKDNKHPPAVYREECW